MWRQEQQHNLHERLQRSHLLSSAAADSGMVPFQTVTPPNSLSSPGGMGGYNVSSGQMSNATTTPPYTYAQLDAASTVPMPPQTSSLHLCLFQTFCQREFHDVRAWKAHVNGHLGSAPAPSNLRCPFRPCELRMSWSMLLEHAADHFNQQAPLQILQFEDGFVRSLRQNGVITSSQVRAHRQTLQASSTNSYHGPST